MRVLASIFVLCGLALGQGQVSGTSQLQGGAQLAIQPLPVQFTLTITVFGSGNVSGTPNGVGNIMISCPSQCAAPYNTGTSVLLTETPSSGNTFSGWGGACAASGTASSCTVLMNMVQAVTATFAGSGGGGGGPTSYGGRIDGCYYNVNYIASCAADSSCSAVCNPAQTVGESQALLQFTSGVSDPLPFPNIASGLANQNNCWTDSDFGTYECWVTDQIDAHMNGSGGSASTQVWGLGADGAHDSFNTDSTLFSFANAGGVQYLFHLIPSIFHANTCSSITPCVVVSNIKGSGTPDSAHFDNGATAIFSRNPLDSSTTMFEYGSPVIREAIINIGGTPVSPTGIDSITRIPIVDWTSDSACFGTNCLPVPCSVLPQGYNATWQGQATISNDDVISTGLGGGAPWPAVIGVVPGTGTTPVTPDVFTLPINNLSITGTISSISGTSGTVTLKTTTSMSAYVNETITINSTTNYNGSYTLLTASNVSPFTYTFAGPNAAAETSGHAVVALKKNAGSPNIVMFQAVTAGTTSATEPNWIAICPLAGMTCTDGSATWLNIGPIAGQGPGFDVLNFRQGIGCTHINTRTERIFRGNQETGASVASVKLNNCGGGSCNYTFTLSSPETVFATQQVTYFNSSLAPADGNYTVTAPISSTSFTASKSNSVLGSITGGSISEPWGPVLTDDATVCNQVGGTNCGTGGVVPLTDTYGLHDCSQQLDGRYADCSATGGGAINNNWGGSGSNITQYGNGSCFPSGVLYTALLGAWSSTTTYTKLRIVVSYVDPLTSTHNYYQLIAAGAVGTPPPQDAAHWKYVSAYCYDYDPEWATGLVRPCIQLGPSFACDAHHAVGYKYFYQGGAYFSHTFNPVNCQTTTQVVNGQTVPCPINTVGYVGGPTPGVKLLATPGCTDGHPTYRNVGTQDLQPFIIPYIQEPSWPTIVGGINIGYPCASYDEEIGISNLTSTGGGTQTSTRFGHNWATGANAKFSPQQAIGDISQLGDILGLSTDAMNTRGDRVTGSATCAHPLRAQYTPSSGQTVTVGDLVMPVTQNNGPEIYQVTSCNGVGSGSCIFQAPLPVWNNCQTVGCTLTSGSGTTQVATFTGQGINSCRGDVIIMDLLSTHVAP